MLTLNPAERGRLWDKLVERIERYVETIDQEPVSQPATAERIQGELRAFDFSEAMAPGAAVDFVADLLQRTQVHTSHRSYYGLFNPNPTTMGIAADALVTLNTAREASAGGC